MDNINYFKNYYNENNDTILERLSINRKNNIKKTKFKLLKWIQAKIKNELLKYDETVEQLIGCILSVLLK